jgi:DNA polymerase I/DNA polymerase-2
MIIYLLDIDDSDAGIVLFGLSEEGQAKRIIDSSYRPSFLVLPSDIQKAKSEIENLARTKKLPVIEIKEVEKVFYGTERKFLKIYTQKHTDLQKVRDEIKSMEASRGGSGSVIDEFEYQIGASRIYLAERDFSCLQWLDLEIENNRVGKIAKIERKPKKLKILAFDFEVVEVQRGLPSIVMISLYGEGLSKVITYQKANYREDVLVVETERDAINEFIKTIAEYDPDILVGYNTDLYDMPILRERAKQLKVNISPISRDGSGISLSKRARFTTARIKGRVHIDIFNFVFNILSSILQSEQLTLKNVAHELLGDTKLDMEYEDILQAVGQKHELNRLARYCLKDSELVYRLTEILLPEIEELTRITGQSLFDTSRMPYSQLVEWYYIKRAKAENRVIPNQPKFDQIKERQQQTYEGGFVKEPEAGIHRNIAVVDFASLYPSIIASYNISIDTLNCSCCKENGYKIPDSPYWFCKNKRGFEAEAIEELFKERLVLKEKLKSFDPDSHEYVVFNTRQRALKTVLNASYGYFAYPASRWYSKECAEATASLGRYWIKEVLKEAEKRGFHAIYGDTDSAFLKFDGKREPIEQFITEINEKLPGVMRLDIEDFYVKGLFVPREKGGMAKKRYALLDSKGRLKVRGLEVVRRDISRYARETQQEILKICLIDEDIKRAFRYLDDRVKALREGKYELRDFVVYEQLSKPISEYKLIAPHVMAAKKLAEKGIPVGEGSVVGYIIQKGHGSISERAYPVELADISKIDMDYYIENQLIPVSIRILKAFKSEENLF